MSNINLYQGPVENETSPKRSAFSGSGGFLFSLLMVSLVVVASAVLKYVNSDLESKNADLTNKLSEERLVLSSGGSDMERVYDFDVRSKSAKKNIDFKTDEAYIYSTIEDYLIPEVVADNIGYTNQGNVVELTMSLQTVKFVDVARQLMSLKKSEKFSGVLLEGITMETDSVSFVIRAIFLKNK